MYSRGHLEGTTLPKRCGITRQKIECIVKSVSFDRELYSGEISIEYILDSKVISHSTLQDRPTHTTFSIVFPVKGFHHKIPHALWPEGWLAAVTLCSYWLSTKLFIHVHVYAGCPCGSESIRSGEIGSPTTLLSRKYSLYWKGREKINVFLRNIEWCRVLVDQSTLSGFICSLGMWYHICQQQLAVGQGSSYDLLMLAGWDYCVTSQRYLGAVFLYCQVITLYISILHVKWNYVET